jgi:hypothetical protein
MMCDAFRRLKFGSIESYQYVGLGSVYFSDFLLFHRSLGIDKMVSIEADTENDVNKKARFSDNLPFSNIEIRWGLTNTELPKVDLDLRTIAWLDYDDKLSRSILDDVRNFSQRAASGSVFVISVQCNASLFDKQNPRRQILDMETDFGPEYISPNTDDSDLQGWGMAKICRQVILNTIEETLSRKNGARPESQRMYFQQIFNFVYKDGARMLTVGGVFYDRGQRSILDQCEFSGLEFVRSNEDYFHIDIPLLTLAELRRIDRQMPIRVGSAVVCGSMPPNEATKYTRLYRYFPNFTAVDF